MRGVTTAVRQVNTTAVVTRRPRPGGTPSISAIEAIAMAPVTMTSAPPTMKSQPIAMVARVAMSGDHSTPGGLAIGPRAATQTIGSSASGAAPARPALAASARGSRSCWYQNVMSASQATASTIASPDDSGWPSTVKVAVPPTTTSAYPMARASRSRVMRPMSRQTVAPVERLERPRLVRHHAQGDHLDRRGRGRSCSCGTVSASIASQTEAHGPKIAPRRASPNWCRTDALPMKPSQHSPGIGADAVRPSDFRSCQHAQGWRTLGTRPMWGAHAGGGIG